MSFNGSRLATSTDSSILWIVALTRAELDHFAADLRDEAAIRRAAGRRQLGRDAGGRADRLGQRVAERAGRRQERLAAERPVDAEVEAVALQDRFDPVLQRARRRFGAEAEVEVDDELARDHVAGAGAGVDVRDLPAGRREVGIAAVPHRRDQFGERRCRSVDRIAGELRIGDVALHALDAQLARQRAAAPVLDHVAERAHRGRLADDAVVEPNALRSEPVAERDGAVERRPFLVARDQEGDRAGGIGARGDELLDRDHHRGERALHVGGAAAMQHAVAVARHERVAGPLLERPGRHDVGVAGEREDLRRRRAPRSDRPQVGDAAVGRSAGSVRAIEAERRQAGRDQILAAAVRRRHRAAGDQLFSKVEGSRHGLARALRNAAGSPTSCCALPAGRRS